MSLKHSQFARRIFGHRIIIEILLPVILPVGVFKSSPRTNVGYSDGSVKVIIPKYCIAHFCYSRESAQTMSSTAYPR
jgi:hypothetical protein